jgi:hypothetical protein
MAFAFPLLLLFRIYVGGSAQEPLPAEAGVHPALNVNVRVPGRVPDFRKPNTEFRGAAKD